MSDHGPRGRRAAHRLTALLAIALLCLVPGMARAAGLAKPAGKLSGRLQALAQPGVMALSAADQARRLGLPARGGGSLVRDSQGRVLAYLRVSRIDHDTVAALKNAGARIVHQAPEYGIITAYLDPARLPRVSGLAAVRHVQEAVAPLRASWCLGEAVSEGDELLRARQARDQFGVDGSGVMVGIISDSFANQTQPTSMEDDIRSGDLPGPENPCGYHTPVNLLSPWTGSDPGNDEGRAMAQIVHDLAPGAELAFATAMKGLFDLADQVQNLAHLGCQVIVDDVLYLTEPFFQDGPIAQAVDRVGQEGTLYFSAAGNANFLDEQRHSLGSYQAPAYRPTACPSIIIDAQGGRSATLLGDCHDFDPGPGQDPTMDFNLEPGRKILITLQWAEPWFGVTNDVDLYLVDRDNHLLAYSNEVNPGNLPWPAEYLSYTNDTTQTQGLRIIVNRFSGSGTPSIKYIFFRGLGITDMEYTPANSSDRFGPAIVAHPAATQALAVAAVPYSDIDTPEIYSSRGPAYIYFQPVTSNQPAAPLDQPEIRQKPEITAVDGVATTFFARQDPDGTWRFYGTSAAAPHAAGVAALLLSRAAAQGLDLPARFLKQALTLTATGVPGGAPLVTGSGLLDAQAAAALVNPGLGAR